MNSFKFSDAPNPRSHHSSKTRSSMITPTHNRKATRRPVRDQKDASIEQAKFKYVDAKSRDGNADPVFGVSLRTAIPIKTYLAKTLQLEPRSKSR